MYSAKVLIYLLLIKHQDVLNCKYPADAVHVFEHLNRNKWKSNLAIYLKSSNMKPHSKVFVVVFQWDILAYDLPSLS